MTNEELRAQEAEVSRLAHELVAEVERVCQQLDPSDPEVIKLRANADAVVRNIEAARDLGDDDDDERYLDRIRNSHKEVIYSWEMLPVYEWTNEFARVIGRLLAILPKRHYIFAHNLAGAAHLISNCIACGHRDPAPGEVIPLEELRAYRTIGHHATFTAMKMLEDLAAVTKLCAADIARGRSLVGRIRQQFEIDLAACDDTRRGGAPNVVN
jgi:hypothetical protein